MTGLAVTNGSRTAAIGEWDSGFQLLVKQTVLKPKNREATAAELALLAEQAVRTGLDPMSRQIYGIFRKNKRTGQEVMTIQVGIDGLRVIAERTGHYLGQSGPFWWDGEGWTDVWFEAGPPEAAKVIVRKAIAGQVAETPAVAHRAEYMPTYNGEPQGLWADKPALMLAKCFDDRTEVLTTNGFERFAEATGQVLQVTERGVEPCDAVPFWQPYRGPMVVLDSDDLNFAVTPNHDMVTTVGKIEAGAMFEQARARAQHRIPRSVSGTRVESPISDPLLMLAAAYVADGFDRSTGFRIGVSRKAKIERLQGLGLHSAERRVEPGPSTSKVSGRTITPTMTRVEFDYDETLVSGLVGRGKVVNVGALLSLSRRQVRVFVDTLIAFDGRQAKSGVRRMYTSRLDHLAAFEVAAIAAGYAVSPRRSRTSDISDRANYYVTVSDRDEIAVVRWGRSYKGKGGNARGRTGLVQRDNEGDGVWCVTVPSGEIIVRRDGFSMRCGNCAEALALRKAFPADMSGLYTDDEMSRSDTSQVSAPAPLNREALASKSVVETVDAVELVGDIQRAEILGLLKALHAAGAQGLMQLLIDNGATDTSSFTGAVGSLPASSSAQVIVGLRSMPVPHDDDEAAAEAESLYTLDGASAEA